MTDEKIIEALECCAKNIRCDECPLKGIKNCMGELYIKSFDLIKRQQEEIERLKSEKDSKIVMCLARNIDKAKSKAVREFAERLIELGVQEGAYEYVSVYDIECLAKEMTEKEGGKG